MGFRQVALVSGCVIALAMLAFPVKADEAHTESAEHASETEHHRDTGHQFKNGLALFLGATNEHGHGTEGTWGIEYGRYLSPHWSVGGLIDYAGGGQRNLVIAPAVYWKPFGGGFVVLAAPGVEYHNGRGTVGHHLFKAESAEEDKDETYFILRLGTAYFFQVGSRFAIGPAVNVDFVNGEQVWVYGVNFEMGF